MALANWRYINVLNNKAATAPHSGDWLNALPIASCGLRMDDESVRVSVAAKKTGLQVGVSEGGLQFVLNCNNARSVPHCLFVGS